VNVLALFAAETAASILETGLALAAVVGLPVSTWRAGDPTRALFKFVAEVLGAREEIAVLYAKSAFLSTAEGDWLTVVADEVYGVTRTAAAPATSTITLFNGGGGHYEIGGAGGVVITVASSVSGVTYHSTSALTLAGLGATGTVEVEADVAGSDGSAGEDEIDTMITSLLGVSITASTVAVGVDEQDDQSLRLQCEATLGALSPNGPPDAYEFVACNVALTGAAEVTRAQSSADSATGAVTVWIASASGAASGASVTAVQAAIDEWATPLAITATVEAATEVEVAVTATVTAAGLPASFEADAEAAVAAMLAAVPVGSAVTRSALIATIHDLAVAAIAGAGPVSVVLSAPAADVELDDGEVATVGAVSVTEA
jgi:hypothetical protein